MKGRMTMKLSRAYSNFRLAYDYPCICPETQARFFMHFWNAIFQDIDDETREAKERHNK